MMDMMLTGRIYDADEGQAIGLSHYLVPAGAGLAKGIELAKHSIPNTVGSSMALRFCGRASKRTAMSPRRSALSERGSFISKPPGDLLTRSSQLGCR